VSFDMDVRADFKQVERMLSVVQKKAIPKAGSRALNKVVKVAEKTAAKGLADDIGIVQKESRKHLRINRARWTELQASIVATGRRLPLMALKAKQVKKGVTYRKQGGGRGRVQSAFIATMRSGHKGVFKRQGKQRRPIQELFGPSIPHVFVKDKISRALLTTTRARWPKLFQHEINRELRKYR